MIRLNVGGTSYVTTPDTLNAEPGYLSTLIKSDSSTLKIPSPINTGSPDPSCQVAWPSKVERNNGNIFEYFIDRSGQFFAFVLEYLRNLQTFQSPDDPKLLKDLLIEAQYYRLPGLIKNIEKKLSSPSMSRDINIIRLNVGGTIYVTSPDTLNAQPSYLASLINWKVRFAPLGHGPAEYFIDRNGHLFQYVLDFLRNLGRENQFQLPTDIDLLKSLLVEAKYYQLTTLMSMIETKLKHLETSFFVDTSCQIGSTVRKSGRKNSESCFTRRRKFDPSWSDSSDCDESDCDSSDCESYAQARDPDKRSEYRRTLSPISTEMTAVLASMDLNPSNIVKAANYCGYKLTHYTRSVIKSHIIQEMFYFQGQ